jgi:4-amino-4-deoxy-L-arabinose transferase-like glycosyltransferase
VIAAVAFLLYAALLIAKVNACAAGSDSSGYMNHARLLGMGRLHSSPRELPGLNAAHFSEFLYTPLGFVPQSGTLVPSYPVGLPLMIVAAHWVAGWNHAGDAVIVVHSLAALLLLFALGRGLGLSERACLLATIVLAASPLFLDFSLQAMSDVPALAWTSATALCLWLARRRIGWSVPAGFIFGISVLLRPNNVLMLAPAMVAWWPRWSAASARALTSAQALHPVAPNLGMLDLARRIIGFGLGGLPAAAGFALHSHAAYGHWLTTGYGDASSLFQPAVIPLTLRHYAQWMPVSFSAGVWLFLLLPLALWRSREAAFLFVWGLAYLGFYVSYFHTHEAWWYLRFVLPAAPAYLLGAIWMAQWIWRFATRAVGRRIDSAPNARRLLCALALVGIVGNELKWDRQFQVLAVGHGEGSYSKTIDWLHRHAPANSVLEVMQASGAAFYYSDFIALRWDQMTAATFPEVAAAAAREGRAIYAPLFPFETEPALKKRMPGIWTPVGQVREVVIYRWAGAPQVLNR